MSPARSRPGAGSFLLALALAAPVIGQTSSRESPESPEGTIVVRYAASGVKDLDDEATVVLCTNLGAAGPLQVLFYDSSGVAECTAVDASVGSSETVIFATRNTFAYTESATCAAPGISQGRLEIQVDQASTARFICTAQILEADQATPGFVTALKLHLR